MSNYQLLFSLCMICVTVTSPAKDNLKLKSIALTVCMQDQLAEPIALPIPVPVEYEQASIPDSPVGYSYWMRSKDAQKSARTGSLPSRYGYMYGKISLDVGYDDESDLFIGVEDLGSIAQAKATLSSLTIERCGFEKYPVLLVKAEMPGSGKVVYAMYVASRIEKNTVYIALRPPHNDRATGEELFDDLRRSLAQCSTMVREQ